MSIVDEYTRTCLGGLVEPNIAGLITIEKGYAGKRARTWVTLTKAGQAALADEIAQLKLLISQIERAGTSPDRHA